MNRAPLADIETVVRAVVAHSSLADRVRDIRLEEATDGEGFDFLRVIMAVQAAENLGWSTLEPIAQQIEDQVGEIDERFPSIRLAEAA